MDPIEEGEKHYLAYGSEYRNPYPPGTDEHNQFERGWSQTLKRCPKAVARIDKKGNDWYQQTANHKSTLTAEAYRNAKGK